MPASGPVSEHDSECYSGSRSSKQTEKGEAGYRWRARCQHEAGNSHTQGPENYANFHGVLQNGSALP